MLDLMDISVHERGKGGQRRSGGQASLDCMLTSCLKGTTKAVLRSYRYVD